MDIQQNSEIGIDDLLKVMLVKVSKIKSPFGFYIFRYQKSGFDIVFSFNKVIQHFHSAGIFSF